MGRRWATRTLCATCAKPTALDLYRFLKYGVCAPICAGCFQDFYRAFIYRISRHVGSLQNWGYPGGWLTCAPPLVSFGIDLLEIAAWFRTFPGFGPPRACACARVRLFPVLSRGPSSSCRDRSGCCRSLLRSCAPPGRYGSARWILLQARDLIFGYTPLSDAGCPGA